MKKLLLLLLIISFPAAAQTTLTAGTNSFRVNGDTYPLNSIAINAPTGDTTKAGLIVLPNKPLVYLQLISHYVRAGGTPFANRHALLAFYDSFMTSATGGGVYMAIGAPVAGAAISKALRVDADGNLAQYSAIPWVAVGDSNTATGYATRTYVLAHSGGGGGSDTGDIHYFTSDYTVQDLDGNIAMQVSTSSGSYTFGNPFTTYITLDELSSTMSTNADIEAGYITALSGITSGDPTKTNHVDYTPVAGLDGQYLRYNTDHSTSWEYGGTVTAISIVSANGFAGTVANPTTTPSITVTTSISGLLKGNGTSISAAVSGTDYQPPATTAAGYGITNVPTIVSGADLAAVTVATTVATYAVTATADYSVGGYLAITAVVTDVIEYRVTWTDQNSTSQTQKFYPMGVTTSGLSAAGYTPFSTVIFRALTGTNIVVATVLTTGIGSITYDVGSRILKL